MQNLTYQKVQFLFSAIGPAQIATYTDKDGVKKLILKEKGLELIGGASASYGKAYTDDYMKKAVLLTQTKNAPAETSNVQFGFRVVSKYRTPAYIDNSEFWPHGKWYGGIYPNLSTFTDAQVVGMDNAIIDMITADAGFSNNPTTPGGAVVRIRRAYTVVDTDNSDASGFTVTWPDGTTTVIATAATFADGQLGTQIMANATVAYGSTVKALLEVYQIAVDTYVITSRNPGLKFSLGTAVDSIISVPGLLLDSKYDDINFDLQFDTYEWAAQGLNLTKLSQSSFTTALNAHISVDGTVTEVIAATNQATQLAAISAITGITALNDSTLGFTIASALTVDTMMVNFPVLNLAGTDPLTATTAAITYEATSNGRFSSLNADDVQRIFAEADHAGYLRTAIRGNFPTVAGISYTKFLISGINTVGAIHGASHLNSSKVTIEIFVPTSACRGNLWDATDNASGNDVCSGTADMTIEELLTYWAS
jgi:hypothetical protein